MAAAKPVALISVVHVPREHFTDACAMSWEDLCADARFEVKPSQIGRQGYAQFRDREAGDKCPGPFLYWQGWTALS